MPNPHAEQRALIEKLRALLAKATPGPWTYEDDDEGSSMGWICAPNPTYPSLSGETIFDVNGDSAQQAINAEFAVAAVNALPGILAPIDHLEADGGAEEMKEACAKLVEQRLNLLPTLADNAAAAVLYCIPDALRALPAPSVATGEGGDA